MTAKKTVAPVVAKAPAKKPATKPVNVRKLAADVAELGGAMGRILDLLEAQQSKAVAPALNPTQGSGLVGAVAGLTQQSTLSPIEPADISTVSVAASTRARPNNISTNPEWEEVAREILGPALDHTEVEHEKSGGIKFTVVIKKEYSNADAEYLRLVKVDRRTKEISQEGMAGAEEWCRQIKANLTRMAKLAARQ